MAYSEKVIDHYNNPRNMGSLPKDDKQVGTGIVGAPECGDVMKLQIKVENDVIVDAKFKTSAAAPRSPAPAWRRNGSRAAQLKRRTRSRTPTLCRN